MRNISFDESSVLTEFARIANKSLVKTAESAPTAPAAPTAPTGSPLTKPVVLPAVAQKAKETADKAKREEALKGTFQALTGPNPLATQKADDMMPQDVNALLDRTTAIDDARKNDVKSVLAGGIDDTNKNRWDKAIAEIQDKDPELFAALQTKKPELFMTKKILSKRDVEMSKTATEGYDVSGETGTDLVDSAHPGNMHTEMAHKDEGNLVETIVEQQEADKEVALANPRGTYATLMGLRDRLMVQGNEDVVAELDAAIKLVATPEEVLKYQLISLANKLDAAGFVEVADRVDALIKTALEPLDRVHPVSESAPAPVETKQYNGGVEDVTTQTSYPTDPPGTLDFGDKKLKQFDVGLNKDTKAAEVAHKFQIAYNKLMGAGTLAEDSKWGPKTNKAYTDVGGWAGLNKALQQKEQALSRPQPYVAPHPEAPMPAAKAMPGITQQVTTPLAPATVGPTQLSSTPTFGRPNAKNQ